MRTSLGPYTKKWLPFLGLDGRVQTLSTGTIKERKARFFHNLHHLLDLQKQACGTLMTFQIHACSGLRGFFFYLTTLWGRSTPGAITQADSSTKPLQLKARITTILDAGTRVMKQTLCRTMCGHWRPAAPHH